MENLSGQNNQFLDNDNDNDKVDNNNSLINGLITIWKNEKFSNDILLYQNSLISTAIDLVEKTEKELKDSSIEKENSDIIELDIERMKFLIKDYLRIRIMKIEKYLFYILKNDLSALLSENEVELVIKLINMKSVYFNEGLKNVNQIANNFRYFTDRFKLMKEKISYLNDAMIVSPSETDFVIIQSITDENLIINMKEVFDKYEYDFVQLEKNDICIIPYIAVKDLIKKNKVKLI